MRKWIINAYVINMKSCNFLRFWCDKIFTTLNTWNRKIYLKTLKGIKNNKL